MIRLVLPCLGLLACGETTVVYEDPGPEWPDPRGYPGLTGGRLLLPNSGDDTISVVDIVTLEHLDRAPVGLVPVEKEGPHHMAVTPDAQWAFIGISNFVPGSGSGPHGNHGTGDADGYCLKMSLEDNRVVADVRVDRNPGDVRLMPDGITVVQSHFDLLRVVDVLAEGRPIEEANALLVVIDGATMQIQHRVSVCPSPHGTIPSPDGSEVYLACYGSDEVGIVNMTSGDFEVERVPVGDDPQIGNPTYGPYAVSASPLDGSVWLSCWMDAGGPAQPGEVRVFDPATREMDPSRTVRIPGDPMFGTFNRDGTLLYMPSILSDLVTVIETETGDIVVQEPLDRDACLSAHMVSLSADETTAYVVCEGDHIGLGSLLELDAETLEMRRFTEVGVWPDDVVVVMPPE